MAKQDCGCEILEKANTFEVKIDYCPTHDAAFELLRALRYTRNVLHVTTCQQEADCVDACEEAKELLDAIRNTKVKNG